MTTTFEERLARLEQKNAPKPEDEVLHEARKRAARSGNLGRSMGLVAVPVVLVLMLVGGLKIAGQAYDAKKAANAVEEIPHYTLEELNANEPFALADNAALKALKGRLSSDEISEAERAHWMSPEGRLQMDLAKATAGDPRAMPYIVSRAYETYEEAKEAERTLALAAQDAVADPARP
jgi:hypothetical protein